MELIYKMRGVLAAHGITTQKEQNLFLEAFRRRTLIGGMAAAGPIEKAWIGLGFPSTYKSRYFKTFDGITTPRISHWWILTAEGVAIYQKMVACLNYVPTKDEQDRLNEYIFNMR